MVKGEQLNMIFFEFVGYLIAGAIGFLCLCYISLSFWCAIDDIKELIEEKRRVKHEHL